MPLPASNTPWPPKALAPILPRLAEWSAWYSGDPATLRTTHAAPSPTDRPGGIAGLWNRLWWGRQIRPDQRPDGLHIPLASDICQGSAELLYSEPPTFTVEAEADRATAERLAEYVDDDLHGQLLGGAEIGAALGGRYHKVVFDREFRSRPFLTTVHADNALPEFRWGRLVAVTFWWTISSDQTQVWRHVERHELDAAGNGLTYHALYQGTHENLGRPVPLTDHPSTASLALSVDADGAVVEGRTPGLNVVYIPNRTPQRAWRTHPLGKDYGRSDLDGVTGLLDALDEAWASLMRDLRLGKARILAAESMLDYGTPGSGASFDLDREVFQPMNTLTRREGSGLPIEVVQFQVRTEQHLALIHEIVDTTIRQAGYSARTFTDPEPGDGDKTAEEIRTEQGRSMTTRGHKVRHEKAGVRVLLQKMLAVDADVFGTRGVNPGADVSVQFPDSIQSSALSLAATSAALYNARSASAYTRVKMVHPDWTESEVEAEVSRIEVEFGTGPAGDPYARIRPDGTDVDVVEE